MRKIILASNNKHKIKEFKEIFTDAEILSLNDIWFHNDINEDWKTFLDNALIKCNTVRKFLIEKWIDAKIIADDSWLCVNTLNWEPWIHSARYAWWHWDDAANRKKLLNELKWKSDRSAYFNCTIVEMFPNWEYIYGGVLYSIYSKTRNENIFFGEIVFAFLKTAKWEYKFMKNCIPKPQKYWKGIQSNQEKGIPPGNASKQLSYPKSYSSFSPFIQLWW